jgi:hypothetical protein
LIDDVRLFGVELPELEMVTATLLTICPRYRITFVNSAEFVGDILVAEV